MKKCMILVATTVLSVSAFWGWTEEAAKPSPAPERKRAVPRKALPRSKVMSKSELLRFIPAPPKGWTAPKPTSKTQRVSAFAVTQVTRVFRKGRQQITFILEDLGTNNPYFYMDPWKPLEKKTPEKYTKKLMLGKIAAEETYNKEKKQGLIFLVFEKRIQLNVSGSRVEDTSVLVELAKKVNFKELKEALEESAK